MLLNPKEHAAALLEEHGPPQAWQTATREAIEAHLVNDVAMRDHWKAVQAELSRTAPRPGPGDLDVYRTAHLLIAMHGHLEAWRITMEKAAREEGNLYFQAISLRVADAIKALSPGGPEEGRTIV